MASISEVAGDDKRTRASRNHAGFDQRRRTSESACDNRSAGLKTPRGPRLNRWVSIMVLMMSLSPISSSVVRMSWPGSSR